MWKVIMIKILFRLCYIANIVNRIFPKLELTTGSYLMLIIIITPVTIHATNNYNEY